MDSEIGFLEVKAHSRPLPFRIRIGVIFLWCGAVLLWPIGLLAEANNVRMRRAARLHRTKSLWRHRGTISTCPPKLGVRFRERCGETAVVRFDSSDALRALKNFLKPLPHLRDGDFGDALDWLSYADPTLPGRTLTTWKPIRQAAIELIKMGLCSVECRACEKVYPATDIAFEQWEAWVPAHGNFRGGGNAGECFRCPEEHVLIEEVTAMA